MFDRSRAGIDRRSFLRLAAVAGAAGPLLETGLERVAWGQTPKKGGTLTVGINTDIVSLDPNDIVFANVPMFFQLYDYLVTFGTNLEPQPSLAESWELAKDGTSATFKLRENVRTHSGGAFDADALLANFQRVKDKATGGGLFSRLEDFTAADKLDARTVRFRFARPRPDFLAMVSRWGMVDPAAFATLKQKGGGTGPFKLAEWVPGDHLTFVRNDGYWQAGLPYLDRVVFRVLSDAGAMENAFRAGQIDVAHTIPNKDAQRLRGEGLQVQPAPVPNEYYVVILNTRKPPFDNLKVRQAMRYLLDRETIAKTILGGIGKAQVQVAAPGTPALRPEARRGVRVQPREGPRAPHPGGARRQDHEGDGTRVDQHAGEPGDRADHPGGPQEGRHRGEPQHRRAVALLPGLLRRGTSTSRSCSSRWPRSTRPTSRSARRTG